MTTYRIKAPDGKTYTIQGPEGATDEEVRAEVLRQHPSAGSPNPYQTDPALQKQFADAQARQKQAPTAAPGAGVATGTTPLSFAGYGSVPVPAAVANAAAGAGKVLTDRSLGLRQGAAALGMGDAEALAKEAKEKQQRDAPLMADTAGKAGAAATSIGLDVGTGMGIGGMLPRTGRLAYAGNVPVTGAINEASTPSPSYDLPTKAATGAGMAMVGDAAMRGLQRVVRPGLSGTQQTRDAAERLEAAGMPNVGDVNRSDNPVIRALFDVADKMTMGRGTRNQNANREWYTERVTAPTGTTASNIGPRTMTDIKDALTQEAAGFRNGPPVNVLGLPQDLKDAARTIEQYAATTSQNVGPNRLRAAAEGLDRTPVRFNTQPTPGNPANYFSPFSQNIDANMAFNLRSAASTLAHGTEDPVLKAQYRRMRDFYDDAITATHPDGGTAFNAWKQKWGAKEDLDRAVLANPDSARQTMSPQVYARALNPEARLRPGTNQNASQATKDAELITQDARLALPEGKATGAGYLAAALLGGGLPIAGAALGELAGDKAIAGGTVGALGTGALVTALTRRNGRWLSRTPFDPETSALVRNVLNRGLQGYVDSE